MQKDPSRSFLVKTKRKLDTKNLPIGILPLMHLTHTQTKKTMENEGDYSCFSSIKTNPSEEGCDESFFKNLPRLGFNDRREEAARFEIDITETQREDDSLTSVLNTLTNI